MPTDRRSSAAPPRRGRSQLTSVLAASFGLLVVSQLLGQEGAHWIDTAASRAGIGHGVLWNSLLIAANIGSVVLAHRLVTSYPRPSRSMHVVILLLTLIALILPNTWISHITTYLAPDSWADSLRALGGFVLACGWIVLGVHLLPSLREGFEVPIDLSVAGDAILPTDISARSALASPAALIALVSRVNLDQLHFDAACATATLSANGVIANLHFDSIDDDIERLTALAQKSNYRWPWQQLLRAIRPHVAPPGSQPRPLRLILIGSIDSADGRDKGSHGQLALCRDYLRRYPELRGADIRTDTPPLDFEQFNDVRDLVRDHLRTEQDRVGGENVFVDITGGMKIASAAAASATIGAVGRFQYVQTNGDHDVLVSDLHPQPVPVF